MAKTKREQLDEMFAVDKLTYQNIVKVKAFIAVRRKPIADYRKGDRSIMKNSGQFKSYVAGFNVLVRRYNKLLKNYQARQLDYRENTLHNLGKSIEKFNDGVTRFFSSLWGKVKDAAGLGIAPALILPVTIVAGATITAIAIAFFVQRHFDATQFDQQASNDLVSDMISTTAKIDPEGAAEMARRIIEMETALKKDQIKANAEGGFFGQLGKGVKTAVIVVSVAAGGFVVFKLAQSQKLV